MKKLFTLADNGVTYEIVLTAPSILEITKIMEDSGIVRPIPFADLPHRVQEEILDLICK